MWKKIVLLSALALSLVLFSVFFAWRLKFIELPARLALENITGQPVTFSSIEYRPPNYLAFNDLTIGDTFRAKSLGISFNPLTLVRHIKRPGLALVHINAHKPWIAPMRGKLPLMPAPAAPQGKHPDFTVAWDEGEIALKNFVITDVSGRLNTGKKITAEMSGDVLGQRSSVDLAWEGDKGVLNVRIKGDDADADISLEAHSTAGGLEARLSAPLFRYGDLTVRDSSGTVTLENNRLSGTLNNAAGTISVQSGDLEHFTFESRLALSPLLPEASGAMELTGQIDNGSFSGDLSLVDCSMYGRPVGTARMSLTRSARGAWDGKGTTSGKGTCTLAVKKDNAITFRARTGRKGAGSVTGTLAPLALKLRLSDWPVESIPVEFISEKSVTGSIDAEGSIADGKFDIDIKAGGVRTGKSKPLSFSARIFGKGRDYFLRANSADKRWQASARLLASREWEVRAALNQLDIEDVLPWISSSAKARGNLSGDIVYSSKKEGKAQLRARAFSWDTLSVDEGKINAELTAETLSIKEIAFHSRKGTLTGQASVGLAGGKNDCRLDLAFYRFPAGAAVLNGTFEITGALHRGDEWNFEGDVKSSPFQINELPAKEISARLLLSSRELKLKDLQWESMLACNITVQLPGRSLEGEVSVTHLPLETFLPGVKGTVSAETTVRGTLDAPDITARYHSSDMVFNKAALRQSGTLRYKDNVLSVEQGKIHSGNTEASIRGILYPELNVSGMINDAQGGHVATLLNIPVSVKGPFSSAFTVTGPFQKPTVALTVDGRNVSVNDISFSELSGSLSITDNILSIDSMIARFSDSELRIATSTVSLASKKFALQTQWRNIHAGPVDLFGSLLISGDWLPSEGAAPAFHTSITAGDFWLNQHNLKDVTIAAQYQADTITFLPISNQPLVISGHVSVLKGPSQSKSILDNGIKFERLSINWKNKRSLIIDGEIGAKRSDFMLTAKNASSSAIADIIGLPVPVEGGLDVTLVGRGSIDDPQVEGSLNLSEGTVADLPYDAINLQFGVKNDTVTILRAKLIKDKQYIVSASGHAPFYLTKAKRERLKNKPLDLNLAFEQGSLGILSSLSSDIRSASGDMQAQLHLTGTLAAPSGEGFFKVFNGEISAKRYINKLSNLSIIAVWEKNLLTIKEFHGKVGDGNVRISGTVAFDGIKPTDYNLSMQSQGSKGLSIFVPELPIPSPLFTADEIALLSNLSRGEPKCAIRFEGPPDNLLLSGWIELENTRFTYPPLVKGGEQEDILAALWPRVSWDLELRSGKNTWYDNELVSVNTLGTIKLSGKGAFPTVNGRIEALRGRISYLGTEFEVKQAVLEIVKGGLILEAEAVTEAYGKTAQDSDEIHMYIDRAQIGMIKPRFTSKNNPTYTSEKALARATGIDAEMYSTNDQEYLLRQQLIRIFDSTLTTPLAKTLLRNSGLVDAFRVQYMTQEPVKPLKPGNPTLTELLYGTKYSMEKYLGNRFLVGYSVTFDQIQNRLDLRHEIELSYRWQHNIFFRGTYEIETKNPFRQYDRRIIVEQQWRFGWPKKKQ